MGKNRKATGKGKVEEQTVQQVPKYVKVIEYTFDIFYSHAEFLQVFREAVHDGILFGLQVTYVKPNQDADIPVIDVELKNARGNSIIVRIVCHTLYIAGYKSVTQDKWFRFANEEYVDLFPVGTTILLFDDSYKGMGGLLGSTYGSRSFDEAISALDMAKVDANRKCNLRVLAVMICEAARFDPIGRRVTRLVSSYDVDVVNNNYYMIIINWSSACDDFLDESKNAKIQVPSATSEDVPARGLIDYRMWSQKAVIRKRSQVEVDEGDEFSDFEGDSDTYNNEIKLWVDPVKKDENGEVLPMNDQEKHQVWLTWRKSYRLKVLGSAFKGKVKKA